MGAGFCKPSVELRKKWTLEALFPELKEWKEVNLLKFASASPKTFADDSYLDIIGKYTFGGFGEDRTKILLPFYEAEGLHPKKLIHIGVDVMVPKDTKVYAVCDCELFNRWIDPETVNGWGTRLILKCPDGKYLLYGHLQPNATESKIIHKGDLIGLVGDHATNGGWFPHLHFQKMTQKFIDPFMKDLTEVDGYAETMDNVVDPLL